MAFEKQKDDVRAVYMDFYAQGFKTNDLSLIDRAVRYPITYLRDGRVESHDRYPIDPATLKAEKQWDHSTDWKLEIDAANDSYAHVSASATRRRADGSAIEKVHAFYDFGRFDGEWKMYAVAEIVMPAEE